MRFGGWGGFWARRLTEVGPRAHAAARTRARRGAHARRARLYE
jgi:hypothetical protein